MIDCYSIDCKPVTITRQSTKCTILRMYQTRLFITLLFQHMLIIFAVHLPMQTFEYIDMVGYYN